MAKIKQESMKQAKNAFLTEKECIEELYSSFDEETYQKACEMLMEAGKIATSGCGHSGIMCRHFAHLLCCAELDAKFISPAEAVHGGTGFLKEGDVMVFASRGGKTSELLPIVDICKKKKVKIITITENPESKLGQCSDLVIKMYINRETDKWNCQGTTSSTVLAVIFHSLVSAIIEETNYTKEQFALIHPGGAVGERLNGKNLIQ